MLVNPHRFVAPLPAAAATYTGFKTDDSSGSSSVQTIPALAIGDAAADRRVVVVATWFVNGGKTLSSATIGGVAAALHVQTMVLGALGCAIISAPLAAGTTADVVLTLESGGSSMSARAAAFRVVGLASGTPGDTASATGTSHTIGTTIDVVEDGVLIAGMFGYANASEYYAVGVERFYNQAVGTDYMAAGGSLDIEATESDRTVSFERSGSGALTFSGAICAVAFR